MPGIPIVVDPQNVPDPLEIAKQLASAQALIAYIIGEHPTSSRPVFSNPEDQGKIEELRAALRRGHIKPIHLTAFAAALFAVYREATVESVTVVQAQGPGRGH